MNILIIHQHYFPEMSGTARRAKELAEHFVNQNHKVSIITSFPRQYRSLPSQSFKRIERLNGVDINRVKNISLKGLSLGHQRFPTFLQAILLLFDYPFRNIWPLKLLCSHIGWYSEKPKK